jgi:hypothetical protein
MYKKKVKIMALESKQSVTLHDCHEQISKTVLKSVSWRNICGARESCIAFFFGTPCSVASERHTRFNFPAATPFVPTSAEQTQQNIQNQTQRADKILQHDNYVNLIFSFPFVPHVTDRDFQNTKATSRILSGKSINR